MPPTPALTRLQWLRSQALSLKHQIDDSLEPALAEHRIASKSLRARWKRAISDWDEFHKEHPGPGFGPQASTRRGKIKREIQDSRNKLAEEEEKLAEIERKLSSVRSLRDEILDQLASEKALRGPKLAMYFSAISLSMALAVLGILGASNSGEIIVVKVVLLCSVLVGLIGRIPGAIMAVQDWKSPKPYEEERELIGIYENGERKAQFWELVAAGIQVVMVLAGFTASLFM